MPTLKKIRATMQKQKIDDEIMAQMDFEADCNNPYNIISLIEIMDELLTKEQCLSIMEKQGCCKGGQRDKDCKAFAEEHGNKTLSEKLPLMSSIQHMMSPCLNDDGTFTITFSDYQNGVHEGNKICCNQITESLMWLCGISMIHKKVFPRRLRVFTAYHHRKCSRERLSCFIRCPLTLSFKEDLKCHVN